MKILGKGTDRHGRVWEARLLTFEESEEEDLRFWQEELTPAERVATIRECTRIAHGLRSDDEFPGIQRVCRVLRRPRS